MLPTRLGVTLTVLAGTAYLMAWLTRIGWLYMPVSVVLAILLINLVLPYFNVRGLRLDRRLAAGGREGVFEDDTIELELQVANRFLFPKFVLSFRAEHPFAPAGDAIHGTVVGRVPPRSSVAFRQRIECYRRGVFVLPPIEVTSSIPFGLFRARRVIPAPVTVTVFPKVLPLAADFRASAPRGDSGSSGRLGNVGELRGSRAFERSDSLRNVHWRNSARSGRLMVKEFDQASRFELKVGFNPEIDLGEGRDTTLEHSIRIAAALGHVAFARGVEFRIYPDGAGNGVAGWTGVLRRLARIERHASPAVARLLADTSGDSVSVVVVSAADRPSIDLLRRARYPRPGVVVVLMEGFAPAEDASAGLELSSLGLQVVGWKARDIREGLEALGRVLRTEAGPGAAMTGIAAGRGMR